MRTDTDFATRRIRDARAGQACVMTDPSADQTPDDHDTDSPTQGEREPADPTHTDHPAGDEHADRNAEDESPA